MHSAPAMASARVSRRGASSACSRFDHAPIQGDDALAGICAQRRPECAWRRRSRPATGAKMRLAASIWLGWIRVLPSKPKARALAQALRQIRLSHRDVVINAVHTRPCARRAPPPSGVSAGPKIGAVGQWPAAHGFAAGHWCPAPGSQRRWRRWPARLNTARGVSIIAQIGLVRSCGCAAMSAAGPPWAAGWRRAGPGAPPSDRRCLPGRDSGLMRITTSRGRIVSRAALTGVRAPHLFLPARPHLPDPGRCTSHGKPRAFSSARVFEPGTNKRRCGRSA